MENNNKQNNELTMEEIEEKLAVRKSFKDKIFSSRKNKGERPGKRVNKNTDDKLVEKSMEITHDVLVEKGEMSINVEVNEVVQNNENKDELIKKDEDAGMLGDQGAVSVKEKESKKAQSEDFTGEVLAFPKDFLWGTSTSAYQVEGGIVNDWSEWEKNKKRVKKLEKKGFRKDDFISDMACDSYHRYEEDIDLAKRLGTNAIRLSIEWARIEPRESNLMIGEINHYIKVLKKAKKEGLKTVVTLWHWTNPTWVAEAGGWANKDILEKFEKYVDLIINEMGGLVDYWVTLNEPMIHVGNGYLTGKFPPNKTSFIKAHKTFRNLYKAHRKTYKQIHEHFPQAKVSITQIVNYFEPAHSWNPIEVGLAKLGHYFINHRFLKKIEKYIDYIGVDYYFHHRMVWYPPFKKNKNRKVNDMGWEIYPEGIYHVLRYLGRFKKPIIILENGLADGEDRYRADFIRDHLKYVHKAINEGVDVRGYFYWSLLDNFEWADGYAPKFGLYWVDRKTFERKEKPSASVFREICKNNKLEI